MSAAGGLTQDELERQLEGFAGQPAGPPSKAPDAVNQAMIRHWVEAMGDENPVYVDAEVARSFGFPGVVAPPTMLQAWVMRGYKATKETESARAQGSQVKGDSAQDRLFALLDSAGFTSVVATNCEQEYFRPLVLGDLVGVRSVIESVSPLKRTALGDGHFVTNRLEFTDHEGLPVAAMTFRILRFRPRAVETTPSASAPSASAPAGAAPSHPAPDTPSNRPRRPRPALTQDNAFFFEGTREGRLLIQRCSSCATLRHPPRPACHRCRSLEWDVAESAGRGTVFSYVVVHHPQVPGFDYPLPIAVVELEEGTRLVADLVGVEPEQVRIGMAVQCEFVAVDEDLTLPMFRPMPGTGD